MSYAVKEIFYTLQGEGARSGRAAVFCRFAGCNLWTGREEDREQAICQFCDTDFVGVDGPGGGYFAGAEELAAAIAACWADEAGGCAPGASSATGTRQSHEGVYDVIHQATLDQLVPWWDGTEPPPSGFGDDYLDEVAYALADRGPDGLAVLRRCFDSGDVARRDAALSACAWPQTDDAEIRAALLRAAEASEPRLKMAALWGMTRLGYFPLARVEVERLMRGSDELLAAAAMRYLSLAFPAEAREILRAALSSDNPHMREFACDEIGERRLSELSHDMQRLVEDSDSNVSQAARSNLEFFADEIPASRNDASQNTNPSAPSRLPRAPRPYVVFTGGEPALQLDAALIEHVHAAGFEVAIETNGTRLLPPGVDWICVSPKAGASLRQRRGNELKLVYPQQGAAPEEFAGLEFEHFFLQPMDGPHLRENMSRAVAYCLAHPQWRIGLQTHKVLGIA